MNREDAQDRCIAAMRESMTFVLFSRNAEVKSKLPFFLQCGLRGNFELEAQCAVPTGLVYFRAMRQFGSYATLCLLSHFDGNFEDFKMPLKNIEQPKVVYLSDEIRLVLYDGNNSDALNWYRDPFVYYNSEGIVDTNKIPDESYIQRMYKYLNENSELYFVEGQDGSDFIRIGDVAIKPVNPPIVIGNPNFRGKGYSKLIMKYVIDRLRQLNFERIENSTVYKHNEISLRMHISLGYKIVSETETEYQLNYELGTGNK